MTGAWRGPSVTRHLQPADRIVAVSGSPLAIGGATSTVRMLQLDDDGVVLDLE